MSEEGWQVYCQPFKYEECYIIKVCAGKFGGDDDSCKGKVNGLNMAGLFKTRRRNRYLRC